MLYRTAKPLLFLLTLSVGFMLTDYLGPTTLSEVASNPHSYEGRMVQLHAYLNKADGEIVAITSWDGWTNYWSLDAEKHETGFITAGFELTEARQMNLLPESRFRNGPIYLTEAIVEGYLEPRPSGVTNCFGPEFRFTNTRIVKVYQSHTFPEFKDLYVWLRLNT